MIRLAALVLQGGTHAALLQAEAGAQVGKGMFQPPAAEAPQQKHLVKALLHGQLCRVFRIGIVLDMGQNYDLVVLLLRAGCRVEVAHDHMGLAVQGRAVAVACIAGDDKIIFPQQTGQRRRDRAGRKDHTPCHKQTFLAF